MQGIARHEHLNNPVYEKADWVNDYWFQQSNRVKQKWVPYSYWRQDKLESTTINIDDYGRRKTVQARHGTDKPFIIYTFGSSVMWGWGVSDQHTIPSELAHLLDGRNIKIVNYGELGYISTQSYLQLMLAIRRGERPDLVIFYGGYSDFNAAQSMGRAGVNLSEKTRIKEFGLSSRTERWRTYKLALSQAYSRTLKHARQVRHWLIPPSPQKAQTKDNQALARSVLDVFDFNQGLVKSLGQQYGFNSIFIFQPIRNVAPATALKSEDEDSLLQTGYSLAHQKYAHNQDVFFFDGIISDKSLYLDSVHLGPKGNKVVAQNLLNIIEQYLP